MNIKLTFIIQWTLYYINKSQSEYYIVIA